MCELSVLVLEDGEKEEKKVAENIIVASRFDDGLILRGILGEKLRMKDTIVTELNIAQEELKLIKSRFPIDLFFRFLREFSECIRKGKVESTLLESWDKLKQKGDQLITTFSE